MISSKVRIFWALINILFVSPYPTHPEKRPPKSVLPSYVNENLYLLLKLENFSISSVTRLPHELLCGLGGVHWAFLLCERKYLGNRIKQKSN